MSYFRNWLKFEGIEKDYDHSNQSKKDLMFVCFECGYICGTIKDSEKMLFEGKNKNL